jgi:flagellar motor switch protein FliN
VNNPADIRHWLFEEFSSRLAAVFETMAGERPQIEIEPIAEAPVDAALRWRQTLSGAPGAIWIAASEDASNSVGGHVLRSAGIVESDAASLKSTYLETLSQALSGMAGAIGSRLGREVTCAGGEESSLATDAQWAVLRIHLGGETASIAIGVEAALVMAMATPPPDASAPGKLAELAAAAAATSGFTGPVNSKTFELLLDVELPVSVSFGRAQVQLKDVLKLTTGSIVELNRSILEPVEIIVNNCVIARGEVVVVEGNFGVRVHQVISRQERLRTLH